MRSIHNKCYIGGLIYSMIVIIVFLMSAEYICRMKGIRPWRLSKANITVTPGGKFFTKHPMLGYTHLAGAFRITFPEGYSFTVTHLENTLRITHDLATYHLQSPKPAIWIFGCSFTHGWSLNDQETYPWQLQEMLPQYEIVNFGVSGYGTIHSFIQFQDALSKYPPPKIAIIAYASFHDERNTFLRNRRKAIVPWNYLGTLNQPYARLRSDGLHISSSAVAYRPFPLMQYSAFSHFLEQTYNKIEDRFYHSHDVTKAIIQTFNQLATESHVQLIVAGITSDFITTDTLEYARSLNIIIGDISVDFGVKGNTNAPHDYGHPSAQANKLYAQKLFDLLDKNKLISVEDGAH